MKKVFFLIGSLSSGGAERVVANLTLSLNKAVDKEIILFNASKKIDYPFNAKLFYLYDDKQIKSGNIMKIKRIYNGFKKIKKIKIDNPDHSMISFLEYPNVLNILTSRYGKSIVSVRNHMSTKHKGSFQSRFWNFTIKYLYPKAALIVAVSEEIKLDLIDNYNIEHNKIQVIHNFYNLTKIKESSNETLEEKYEKIFRKPVIITAGRLSNQKGQWHLIRAFSKVVEVIPNAQLVLLGDGELKEYLMNLVSDYNLVESVHFIGFQKNPFKYIAKSKMFVLSSFHEGFPNSLAESMACGIPVISSDCLSGPREILSPKEFGFEQIEYGIDPNRYGVLLPVCDGKRYTSKDKLTNEEIIMANSIITLLSDEEKMLYFSNQSLKRIQEFSINKIIKKWEDLI